MRKSFVKKWLLPIALGSIIGIFIVYLICEIIFPIVPSSEHCRLHEGIPVNGVSLINTIDGQNNELRIFEPHETIGNAITEKEIYGYSSTLVSKCYICFSSPDERNADITIELSDLPKIIDKDLEEYYCNSCRDKLKQTNTSYPFILADMYNPDSCILYPLELGATYQIRHYTIIIEPELNGNQQMEIKITSSYFDGGKSLDY